LEQSQKEISKVSLDPAEAFNKFLDNEIRFSGSEEDQASKSQRYLREQLEEYSNNNATFPNFIDGDFLSGSFGRKTAIKPLDDVDIFMILDGTGLYAVKEGRLVPDTVEGSDKVYNPLCNGLYYGSGSLISSQKVLRAVEKALKGSVYPQSTVGDAEQAVNVWLDSYELGLDIIPAFHLTPPGSEQDYYFIPAGKGRDDWIETNPKIDAAMLDFAGGEKLSQLRDVIRLVKYWNQVQNNDRLNGYHVEVMCIRALEEYAIENKLKRYALAEVFKNLPTLIAQTCPSQTGFGGNIDEYLDRDGRILSIRAAARAQVYSEYAINAEDSGEMEKATSHWQSVFGDSFPTD
jgi:hypothetical protein